MEQLSTELICLIASQCDRKSVLKLRQASRYFRDLLAEEVFRSIAIGFNLRDLHRLIDISRSIVAKHVEQLTFNTEVLPVLDRSSYMEYAIATQRLKCPDRTTDFETLRDRDDEHLVRVYSEHGLEGHWREFENLSKDQKTWMASGNQAILQEALNSLPNLQRLNLTHTTYSGSGNYLEELASGSPWRGLLIDPHFYYFEYVDPEDVTDSSPDMDHTAEAAFSILSACAYRQLEKGNKPLTELNMQVGYDELLAEGQNKALLLPDGRPNPHNILESFKQSFDHLTCANWEMTESVSENKPNITKEALECLLRAKNLRSLDLSPGFDSEEELKDAICASPGLLWAHLQHLGLHNCQFRKMELCKLITEHSESLQSLSLHGVTLESLESLEPSNPDRWDDTIEEIGRQMHLRDVSIKGLIGIGPDACNCTKVYFTDMVANDDLSEDYRDEIGPWKTPGYIMVENFLIGKSKEVPPQEEWKFASHTCLKNEDYRHVFRDGKSRLEESSGSTHH